MSKTTRRLDDLERQVNGTCGNFFSVSAEPGLKVRLAILRKQFEEILEVNEQILQLLGKEIKPAPKQKYSVVLVNKKVDSDE